jgi:hypothetical protein
MALSTCGTTLFSIAARTLRRRGATAVGIGQQQQVILDADEVKHGRVGRARQLA